MEKFCMALHRQQDGQQDDEENYSSSFEVPCVTVDEITNDQKGMSKGKSEEEDSIIIHLIKYVGSFICIKFS